MSDDEVLQLADEILHDHNIPVNGNMRGPKKCTACGEIHPCRVRKQAAAAKARILVRRQNEENGDTVNGTSSQ